MAVFREIIKRDVIPACQIAIFKYTVSYGAIYNSAQKNTFFYGIYGTLAKKLSICGV